MASRTSEGTAQSILTTRSADGSLDVVVNERDAGPRRQLPGGDTGGIGILDEMLGDATPGAIGEPGRYRVRCRLPPILTPGEYTVSVWLGTAYENLELHEDVVSFSVEGDDLGRLRRLVKIGTRWDVDRTEVP